MTLREEIAKIICPLEDAQCHSCNKYADSIINLLAEQGYGKMVKEFEPDYEVGKFGTTKKVFQPIERV